jgi:hypothetical protein
VGIPGKHLWIFPDEWGIIIFIHPNRADEYVLPEAYARQALTF